MQPNLGKREAQQDEVASQRVGPVAMASLLAIHMERKQLVINGSLLAYSVRVCSWKRYNFDL